MLPARPPFAAFVGFASHCAFPFSTGWITDKPVTIAGAGRLRSAWRDGPLAYRSFRLLAAGQFTSATGK